MTLRQELSQAWKPLSGSEKEEVKNFVAWYRENQISEKSDFGERERKLRFWGEARGLLTEP
jgi:ferritin